MFLFTTQTILNSLTVAPTGVTVSGASNLVTTADYDKANVIINDSSRYPQLRIGNVRFNWPDILDVYMKKASPEILSTVTFDLTKLSTLVTNPVGFWRVALYVRLNNRSADSFYTNATAFYGHPFYIEFPVKSAEETPATIAARIKAIADKYMLLQTEEKLIDIELGEDHSGDDPAGEDESGLITFRGTNGYQYFHVAKILHWDPEAVPVDCCSTQGDFVDVITGVPVKYTLNKNFALGTVSNVSATTGETLTDSEAPIVNGTEAFGDYNWIIHNLRLPSPANTDWWTSDKNEMPIVGATYDQFIIRLIKERDGIAGGILGQRATTVTTHVFYVNSAYSDNFKAIIEKAIGSGNIRTYMEGILQAPFGTTLPKEYHHNETAPADTSNITNDAYTSGPSVGEHEDYITPYGS